MPRLTVHRDSEADIKMRDLYVVIDDDPEVTLLFGGGLTAELAPGTHRLKITNRLFNKEAEFEVAEGGDVDFQVANIPGGCLFAPLIVLGGAGAYRVALTRKS